MSVNQDIQDHQHDLEHLIIIEHIHQMDCWYVPDVDAAHANWSYQDDRGHEETLFDIGEVHALICGFPGSDDRPYQPDRYNSSRFFTGSPVSISLMVRLEQIACRSLHFLSHSAQDF